MNKNQKIIIFGAIGVLLGLIALIIVLIVKNAGNDEQAEVDQTQLINLQQENEQLKIDMLTSEFDRLNMEFENGMEGQQVVLANDSLVQQYNEARERISNLLSELDREKKLNKNNQEKIRQLEAEIATLKGIAKHYLEEIDRLNKENQGLRQDLDTEKSRNENLTRENETYSRTNAELTQTVNLAKQLTIVNLSLKAYNKKDKPEKNITKAKTLGVAFTVTPNNTAAAGMKDFYIRILSPEGVLLGAGPSFSYDGGTVQSTAVRQVEYGNKELSVEVFWSVNTTLTPGEYSVEVFADGNRLSTGRFTMKK